jgi:ATP/maltotriose-dependent transcriptional regulator MalT
VSINEHIQAGRAALQVGHWTEARDAFEAALREEESAEALEGMGETLWWQGETRQSVDYQERAYSLFRRMGDDFQAATTAIALSVTYISNFGNESAAGGWLARAERLLQPDPGPLLGWLLVTRGYLTNELDVAIELLERGIRLARDSGDRDLELVAVADLGEKLVMAGRVKEGLALVDEAMAGALAGENTRLDTVVFACCDMLVACDLAGDLNRATQWCRVADQFIRKYGCPFLYARCRTLYGSVLLEKGHWAQAEQELTAALRMTEEAGPGLHAEALTRFAELRLRQGRLEEAEALLIGLESNWSAALPTAGVRLARGEAPAAVALLDRRLRHLDERHIVSATTLAVLVEAHIACGELDAANEAAERLDAAALSQDRAYAQSLAVLARGRVAAARGRSDDAIGLLEAALDDFSGLDLPLETARVRFELAGVLLERNPEVAVVEARGALAAFEELGATAYADKAASLLRSLGASARTGPKNVGVLTKREQEVLQLVGLGLSNPEIAQRLYISRKTASHHVSSVLAKLGLRNRAEAVAYAVRSPAQTDPR